MRMDLDLAQSWHLLRNLVLGLDYAGLSCKHFVFVCLNIFLNVSLYMCDGQNDRDVAYLTGHVLMYSEFAIVKTA